MSGKSQKAGKSKDSIEALQARIRELESIQAELEETRQSLAAERTFSESVIASLPGLFFMVDRNGLYHRWNKNLEKLLGYTADEIMLRDCRDFVPPKDKSRIIEATEAGFRDGSFTIEYDNMTREGVRIPFFAQGVSVSIDGGEYIIGVELNLSDLRKTEEALRQSEEQLRALVETATNFAVYRLAFEEGDPEKVRVVFVSPSIKDILDIEDANNLASWFVNIHPDDADSVMADHVKLPRPKRTEQTMRTYHSGCGEWRWIKFLSTADHDRDGRLSYSNGIIIDVTDQVRDREALVRKEEELQRQTDKLARLNTALEVLVEHREQEMRDAEKNVLTAMERLVIPYLEDLARTRLDEEQRTNVEIALKNLATVTGPLTRKLTSWKGLLSSTEIRVADMIRHGQSSKEIADLLGVSINTVAFHRKSIRRKLRLKNRKVNLAAFLSSMEGE